MIDASALNVAICPARDDSGPGYLVWKGPAMAAHNLPVALIEQIKAHRDAQLVSAAFARDGDFFVKTNSAVWHPRAFIVLSRSL